MAKCGSCIHKDACEAWIRHGETLYDDFEYSVEECQYYAPRCKACRHCKPLTNWCGRAYLGCTWFSYEIHEVDANHFCPHGERKDNE